MQRGSESILEANLNDCIFQLIINDQFIIKHCINCLSPNSDQTEQTKIYLICTVFQSDDLERP